MFPIIYQIENPPSINNLSNLIINLEATYTTVCKTKLCTLLEQKQRLEEYLQNQAADLVYVGRLGEVEEPGPRHISVKRAPGMEFLGKRSQAHRTYNIPVLNKRAPGKYIFMKKIC